MPFWQWFLIVVVAPFGFVLCEWLIDWVEEKYDIRFDHEIGSGDYWCTEQIAEGLGK